MKKKPIILVILLLAVGFAAVSTTLFINGQTNISPNQDDFNVYYSDAYVNGTQDKSVITDDTHIVFETELSTLGEKYVLDYEVTNGSKNYDAELVMECTGDNEYLTVTNEFDDETILKATDSREGKLTLELTKSNAGEDVDVTIACTISANAIERDSIGEIVFNPCESGICTKYKDNDNSLDVSIGDEVSYGDEEFYILSNENNEVKLLSKYNLNVGSTCSANGTEYCTPITYSTVKQSSDAIGYRLNENGEMIFPWIGVVPYSTTTQKGATFSEYNNSVVQQYVDTYSEYISSNHGLNILDARLLEKSEIEKFCDYDTYECAEEYSFIYSTTYWTKDVVDDNNIIVVFSSGNINPRYYNVDWGHGVRPVFTINIDNL